MNKAIKNKIPIHVDLLPIRDEIFSGLCLKQNEEFIIMLTFNYETEEYDGFVVIRSENISKYRYWTQEELDEIKYSNGTHLDSLLPLNEINSFYECLKLFVNQGVISFQVVGDNEGIYVGKIEELNTNSIKLRLLSEDFEWSEIKEVEIETLDSLSLYSSFEKEIVLQLETMRELTTYSN